MVGLLVLVVVVTIHLISCGVSTQLIPVELLSLLEEPESSSLQRMVREGYQLRDALADVCARGGSVQGEDVIGCVNDMRTILQLGSDDKSPGELLGTINIGAFSYFVRGGYSMKFHMKELGNLVRDSTQDDKEALMRVCRNQLENFISRQKRILINMKEYMDLSVDPSEPEFLLSQHLQRIANRYKNIYQQNHPFHHIIIDNMFPPDIISSVAADFTTETLESGANDGRNSLNKARCNKTEVMDSSSTVPLINYLYSYPFVSFLESLTNIKNLVPDPSLFGGGLHAILSGGFLKVHTDFNWHPNLKLWRRVNVFIYLNEDWEDNYGGALELWNGNLTHCFHRIMPLANRLVIFSSSGNSYHGHPRPLNTPNHVMRKSIAMYFYSVEPPPGESPSSSFRNTVFVET